MAGPLAASSPLLANPEPIETVALLPDIRPLPSLGAASGARETRRWPGARLRRMVEARRRADRVRDYFQVEDDAGERF